MKTLASALLSVLTLTVSLEAATLRPIPNAATGVAINLPLIGRVIGGGNALFLTAVDVSNNTAGNTTVDFFFDGRDQTTSAPITVTGSIGNNGLVARGAATLRRYSIVHFEDFVDALARAGMISNETRDHGVLGSLFLVYDTFTRAGQGSASARFWNEFGGGTVSVSLAGREMTMDEPQALVAIVRDTRGKSGPQLYTNMFINNTGMTRNGSAAGPVNIALSAYANSTGQPIGTPITISALGPGQTASINQVLTALQVSSSEEAILVFARVTSGNATIAGLTSLVDLTTRDGAVSAMSRAD